MQKTILKFYIKKRIRPLFVADIYENAESAIEDLVRQLNGNVKVIKFGQIYFDKDLFHHFEIKIK